MSIIDCNTVCLMIGPYRNLTTLTAATLFLHPHCQVLNHARGRIYGNPEVDFLADYSAQRMEAFIRFAIEISGGGERGPHGGSITLSHAFDEGYDMKDMFERSGQALIKQHIKCLFWKESLTTTQMIRNRGVDLRHLFEQEPRLRFMMPIRNPMDCALSSIKTGHVKRFDGIGDDPTPRQAVSAILDEFLWYANLHRQFPDRLFHFFEHQMNRSMLKSMAAFLQLQALPAWLDQAEKVMVSKSHYTHEQDLIDFYAHEVEKRFAGHPWMAEGLLAFVP